LAHPAKEIHRIFEHFIGQLARNADLWLQVPIFSPVRSGNDETPPMVERVVEILTHSIFVNRVQRLGCVFLTCLFVK
jgi:hypothetical protein